MAAVILAMALIVAIGAAVVAFVTVPHPRRDRHREPEAPMIRRKRRVSRLARPRDE